MHERSPITDLNQLRVFAEVARTSSITAAAHRLDKPKSTVSRDVARLEQSLGTALLSRNGRRLVLTEAGALFAEHASRILAGIEEATDAVAATTPIARGVLTVQATYWLGHALLVPHLPLFMERFPQINVVLELKDFANLSTHDWDVQLTAGTLADSSHAARRITEISLRLYASTGYVSRHGIPTKFGDLEQHPIVDKHWANGTSPWPDEAGIRPAGIKPRLVVNDMIAIAEAIRAGAGIGWMPSFLAERTLQTDALMHVLPDLEPAPMPVFAIFPRRRAASPKIRAFVDFLAEAFKG
ncbi:LysR family transcriptional regulator [Burkholderia sp. LMG 32019]|uniref:LysR family transcriptional regulator n=1 Tax=Burkholderia sp. LMG 32019 TaxID=3158173 RepID=UPI003C300E67